MAKTAHEICDPIHAFVRLDSDERSVLDSRPFQRLRHVHQLGLSYLVYPGATHKRFEHSLGVLELAGRVFDVIASKELEAKRLPGIHAEIADPDRRAYWRRAVRLAALCHDLGHLPFSHSAESLLPEGWNHERITQDIVLCPEMLSLWAAMDPAPKPEDIVKLALGPRKARDQAFTPWEELLSEVTVGDVFGVDRMDYLLRDAYYTGVPSGRFDHHRLIDTLCMVAAPPEDPHSEPGEPALGVEDGGFHSAQALLVARYFMYSQVYFHPVRRIYNIHLRDFLSEWLPGGRFAVSVPEHLALTDNEVGSAIRMAAENGQAKGHDPACRIAQHRHFRVLHTRHQEDLDTNPDAGPAVAYAAASEFGASNVRYDSHPTAGDFLAFPVVERDGRVVWSSSVSDVLRNPSAMRVELVFITPGLCEQAEAWLRANHDSIIAPSAEDDQ